MVVCEISPVCPKCQSRLEWVNQSLKCIRCDSEFEFRDGYYDFLGDASVYWGEVSRDEMRRVIENAKRYGWRAAEAEVTRTYPDLQRYLQSSCRLDWIFHCLNLSRTNRCLDIGSGWGLNAFGLAKYFDEVWSLEAVRERIHFQTTRSEQDAVTNVRFVRADWLNLPFPDESFDMISANGVLEWVGLSDFSRRPTDVQLSFLSNVHRVLKPGGCLYIGVENRYGYQNFLGARDHSGLPFTSIVPRLLADMIVRLRRSPNEEYTREKRTATGWHDYRTYTHDYWGYRKLLSRAGFSTVDVYWTMDYNFPKHSGPFDSVSMPFFLKRATELDSNPSTLGAYLSRLSTIVPRPLGVHLYPLFSPAFLLYAYKGGKGHSFESMLRCTDPSSTSMIKESGSDGSRSKLIYQLLSDDGLSSIVKFPRFDMGAENLEMEEDLIRRYNRIEVVPFDVDGIKAYRETPIRGRRMSPYSLHHNQLALEWLMRFQRSEGIERETSLDSSAVVDIDEPLLCRMGISEDMVERTMIRYSEYSELAESYPVKSSAEHGDFSHVNIFFDEDDCISVLDWEYYRCKGNPLFDLTFFLLSNCICDGSFETFEKNVCGVGRYSPIMRDVIARFSAGNSVNKNLIPLSMPYVLIRLMLRNDPATDSGQIRSSFYLKMLQIWDELSGDKPYPQIFQT